MTSRPVWAEVDLDAIAHNVATLAATSAPARVCAVIKADAYGHGSIPVAEAALRGGASCLAVALVSEVTTLRAGGVQVPVQVLSQALPDVVDELVAARADATVYTPTGIADVAAAAARAGRTAADPVRVHLKFDTGMHRVGAQPEEAIDLARLIAAEPLLRLAGVFTHPAVADEPGNPFTDIQLERFDAILKELDAAGVDIPCIHAANTAAAMDFPASRFDMVRCGIGIYGLAPSFEMEDRARDLRPALTLKARVGHVKRIAAGERVSYGLHYEAAQETTIASLQLGYADGVPRCLGARGGRVLIGGVAHPIAGTISMDQMTVDCGDHPVAVGDEVVLLGEQGGVRIHAQEWATLADTITYEIVARISPRVPRRYLGTGS